MTPTTKSRTIIATWFHADQPGYEGQYSQTLGDSKSQEHYDIYLRCIYLFFFFLESHKRTEQRYLFINSHAESIITKDFRNQLENWNVKIVVLINHHIPPSKNGVKWRNQFFMLDIISYLSKFESNCIILDSDVIATTNKEVEFTNQAEVIGYVVSQDPTETINGLQVRELSELYSLFTNTHDKRKIKYLGGEFIALKGNIIKEFSKICELYYAKNLLMAQQGFLYCREEAHLFSLVSANFRLDETGDKWISRIWTQPWTFRSIPANWETLVFLHLPAEKKTGIKRVYKIIEKKRASESPEKIGETAIRLYGLLGIPKYGIKKLVFDLYDLRKGGLRHLITRFDKIFR
jgi:hypothetical protein